MGRTKAARMLYEAGAFPKARLRDASGIETWEAIQIAALTANPDITRQAVVAYLAETDRAFQRRLPHVQYALEGLADFELRMKWVFSSWVPLVSNLLPSDTVVIYKRGSSIRIDSTLLAMNGLTWERGSQSLVIWGSDMPQPGASYVLDNVDKTAADARAALTQPTDQQQQDWVRKLISQKQKTSDFWSKDAVMVPLQKQVSALKASAPKVFRRKCLHYVCGIVQGVFGWLTSGISKIAVGDGVVRGRSAEAQSTPSTPGVHEDSETQLKEDVGVWRNCAVYEMRNLCVRDFIHPPVLTELKLKAWWKPECKWAR